MADEDTYETMFFLVPLVDVIDLAENRRFDVIYDYMVTKVDACVAKSRVRVANGQIKTVPSGSLFASYNEAAKDGQSRVATSKKILANVVKVAESDRKLLNMAYGKYFN